MLREQTLHVEVEKRQLLTPGLESEEWLRQRRLRGEVKCTVQPGSARRNRKADVTNGDEALSF